MARAWISLALVLTLVVGATCPATAGETSSKTKVKRTVKEAAKTGGHAARDGALTLGRTTRDFFKGGAATQSMAMRSKSHTIRYIEATHSFEFKPNFQP